MTGRRPRGSRRGHRGFSLVETVVAVAVAGIMATAVLGGLLFTMTQARSGRARAESAAWAQAELDCLRLGGYSFLTVPSTRTLTQTAGYQPCVPPVSDATVQAMEPQIPAGFDHAQIVAADVSGMPVRKITIRLFQTPSSAAYTILSTYVANFVYP